MTKARIARTVSGSGGSVAGLWLTAYRYESGQVTYYAGADGTDSDGAYAITGLATGDYIVEIDTFGTNYMPEYYQGKATENEADPVSVTEGQVTENIDFVLTLGGVIQGVVTSSGAPVGSVAARPLPSSA